MTDDAIKEYNRAARYKPDYVKAHYNLALMLTNKGLADHARNELVVVGGIRHRKALEHYNRGVEYAGKEDLVDSMAEFRESIRLSPGLYQAYNNMGALLAHNGMLDRAIAEYDKGLDIMSDDPELHFNKALALGLKDDHDTALKEFAESIKLNPGFADAHYCLGKTLALLKKMDWAISEYKEALRINPELGLAYFDLGLALEESGKPAEAAEAYKTFIEKWKSEYETLSEFADKRLNDLENEAATQP